MANEVVMCCVKGGETDGEEPQLERRLADGVHTIKGKGDITARTICRRLQFGLSHLLPLVLCVLAACLVQGTEALGDSQSPIGCPSSHEMYPCTCRVWGTKGKSTFQEVFSPSAPWHAYAIFLTTVIPHAKYLTTSL